MNDNATDDSNVATRTTARATRLTHIMFGTPDPQLAEKFLKDFGFIFVSSNSDSFFFRAADSSPYCYRLIRTPKPQFLGFGLEVASREELGRLTQLPGASKIQLSPFPGGGEQVVLKDPSGFTIEVIHGQEKISSIPQRQAFEFNVGGQQKRINNTQRLLGMNSIIKLGHLVLEVADFEKTMSWYRQHFSFLASDIQLFPDNSPGVAFLRLDLGGIPADHHTLAIAQGFMPRYSHSAFEVTDMDAIAMCHEILKKAGWTHAWGIGRHTLGSQMFDYWCDPWGYKYEHYCDGDLVTADVPTGFHPIGMGSMSQWGPPMPKSFIKPEYNLENARGLIHSLRHSSEFTLKKLQMLLRLVK